MLAAGCWAHGSISVGNDAGINSSGKLPEKLIGRRVPASSTLRQLYMPYLKFHTNLYHGAITNVSQGRANIEH